MRELKDILSERLELVKEFFSGTLEEYTAFFLCAAAGVYSLSPEEKSAQECREALYALWLEEYRAFRGACKGKDPGLEDVARKIVEKNMIFVSKPSVTIEVSCDPSGNVSQKYTRVDLLDAAGKRILLPKWTLVDQAQQAGGIKEADSTALAVAAGSRYTILQEESDISDILEGCDVTELELPEEEMSPGERYDFTIHDFLPSGSLRNFIL